MFKCLVSLVGHIREKERKISNGGNKKVGEKTKMRKKILDLFPFTPIGAWRVIHLTYTDTS